MRRKLFLHVGKHKTGSSSVQSYLRDNLSFLETAGFNVVQNSHWTGWNKPELNSSNCFAFSHLVIRPQLLTPLRLRGIMPIQTYEDQCHAAKCANSALHRISGVSLLMSGEAFSFLRTSKERTVYDLVFDGFDVRPILFLREKQSWLRSWQKQTALLQETFPDADMSADSIFNYSDQSWLVEDHKIARFFGPRVCTLNYEAEVSENGSVIPAILRELGIASHEAPPWDHIWLNRS